MPIIDTSGKEQKSSSYQVVIIFILECKDRDREAFKMKTNMSRC